ncbi:MAG: serine hydrolase domain-containing protein, partial [Rhodothermales bacterium]
MNKFLRSLAVLILGILFVIPATGQGFAPISPEDAGLSTQRLARLDSVIQTNIDQRRLAGAVALIARDGQAVHLKSYGMQDLENGTPMPTDAIFRIASMSKAITTTAVMMLYEEGHF